MARVAFSAFSMLVIAAVSVGLMILIDRELTTMRAELRQCEADRVLQDQLLDHLVNDCDPGPRLQEL